MRPNGWDNAYWEFIIMAERVASPKLPHHSHRPPYVCGKPLHVGLLQMSPHRGSRKHLPYYFAQIQHQMIALSTGTAFSTRRFMPLA